MPGTSRCRYDLSWRPARIRANKGTQIPVDRSTTGRACLSRRRAISTRTKTLIASRIPVGPIRDWVELEKSRERIERPVRLVCGPVMLAPLGATRRTSKPAPDRSDANVVILAASAYRPRVQRGTPDMTTTRGKPESPLTSDSDSAHMLRESVEPVSTLNFVSVDYVAR